MERKYTRFCSGEAVFMRPRVSFVNIAKVKDISMGGMAFEYISVQEITDSDFTCDIFTTDESTLINDLPCRIVYQDCIATALIRGDVSIRLRKCGAAYIILDAVQQRMLQELISRFCSTEVSVLRL